MISTVHSNHRHFRGNKHGKGCIFCFYYAVVTANEYRLIDSRSDLSKTVSPTYSTFSFTGE
jgi:hypothetical protein